MSDLYRKVSGTFVLQAFGMALAFVFQIILARDLNPDLYGQYTMFVTYLTVLSIIPILGMNRNLVKEIPKIVNNKLKCSSYFLFSLSVSILLTLLLTICLFFFRNALKLTGSIYILFVIMLLLKVLAGIVDGFLQGQGLVVKTTFLNMVLNNVLKIVFFYAFILCKTDGLFAAIYSFVISDTIAVLIRGVSLNKLLGKHFHFKIDLSRIEKADFIKYSITVAFISGMAVLLQSLDKIIISNLLDSTNVGIYKVCQNYVSLISIFSAPFVAFWPMISKMYSENKTREIQKEMRRIVRLVIYMVTPMMFVILFLSDRLLLVFGQDYVTKEAKITLIILASAFLFDSISGPIGAILTMTKYAKLNLFNNIISVVMNIVLNYVMIKKYGIIGSAIGTGISIIVINLISIIEVKVLLNILSYTYKNLIEILVLSAVNFLVCFILMNIFTFSNLYVYIICFGVTLYAVNGAVFLLTHKELLKKFVADRRKR